MDGREAPPGRHDGPGGERLRVETWTKGTLALSSLVLAVLVLLPAVGAVRALAAGRVDVLVVLYPTLLVVAVAGVIYFGRAHQRLKRRP